MKISKDYLVGLLFVVLANSANASGVSSGDQFYDFYQFLSVNMTGGLGVGIALAAFLIGAGVAAMTSKALPMLAGFVVAGFIAFGPDIILNLVAGSSVINTADLVHVVSSVSGVQ